jgi:mono/diheme cytochrome c family protein
MATRSVIGAIAVLLLIAAALTACGSTGEAAEAPLPSPTTAAAAAPTPLPTATQQAVAPPTAIPAVPAQAHDAESEAFDLGKRVFEIEAGEGVGCSFCHGPDGKGMIGPSIVGKTPEEIRAALGRVDAMGFLSLGQKKVEAVSAYLQWLATQS